MIDGESDDASDRARVASDLRVVCTRIARRVRSERVDEVPQHLYSVLTHLESTGLGVGELASRNGVASPVMTRNVNELVGWGFVRRESHPSDGRRVIVSLTPAGREAIEAVRRNRDEWMVTRLAAVSEADFEVLRLAARVLHRIDEA